MIKKSLLYNKLKQLRNIRSNVKIHEIIIYLKQFEQNRKFYIEIEIERFYFKIKSKIKFFFLTTTNIEIKYHIYEILYQILIFSKIYRC